MTSKRKIVAVEIGSSKIKGAVGEVAPDGTLTVNAIEEERPSPKYVRYGQVQNVKEVANVLNRIVLKLNNCISPAKISAVYVAIGGRSLIS
ncbi:MAG: cell division protein FtsA, partial [Muribaculaceae bacterium]|nr:cell division protein FtsA [Muribaculaceae bacterium]